MSDAKPKPVKIKKRGETLAVSKDGYSFNPSDEHWRLNKDVLISLGVTASLTQATQHGFRQTLRRYAEAMSAMHTYNMAERLTRRSEEHTYELQSLMRSSYAVFCLIKKRNSL